MKSRRYRPLLEKPALEGSIVTIDAMGCLYKTAGQVVQQKADYLFSLKKNSDLPSAELLYEDVQEYFKDLDFSLSADKNRDIPFQSASTHDKKHERIEDRDYAVSGDAGQVVERHPYWRTVRNIGVVDSNREEKGVAAEERRYFVSSLPADARQFAKAVRSHWGIENSLHYVLDASFGCALPHQKCYRKEPTPQIENVTQIIIRALEGGRPNGVKHERETGGNQGIPAPLPEGGEERKAGSA